MRTRLRKDILHEYKTLSAYFLSKLDEQIVVMCFILYDSCRFKEKRNLCRTVGMYLLKIAKY